MSAFPFGYSVYKASPGITPEYPTYPTVLAGLSRIERESLFLTLSRQACKISRMNAKHPTKHVKTYASRKT